MKRTVELGTILLPLWLASACTASSSGPGMSTHDPSGGGGGGGDDAAQAATESALTAEEAVEATTELLGDVGGLVGNGFAGFAGGGQGGWQDFMDGGGLPAFEPPEGCSADVSFLGQGITLSSDCTMPSGRHVEGSLSIGLGAECGPFGLSVSFDLLTESAPGAGDEVRVAGSIELSFADARLYLALTLSEEVHLDAVHATDVAACVVVDLPSRLLAIDGSVLHTVDGEERHGLRIEDLQASICEHPPYTGTVTMHGPVHNVAVTFERPAVDEALIRVEADGQQSEIDLPVLKLPGPLCADLPAVPLDIDYASCGGCGHPDPADGGDGAGPGGGGGPGGGAGDPGGEPGQGEEGDEELPGGDPDDPMD